MLPGVLTGYTVLEYSYWGAGWDSTCSAVQYTRNQNARYGDYGDWWFRGEVNCPTGPVSISTQAHLYGANNWHQASGSSCSTWGWQCASEGTWDRGNAPAALASHSEIRHSLTVALPYAHQGWTWWPRQCWLSNQWTLHCNLFGWGQLAVPDAPATSCLAWPAPNPCAFNPRPQRKAGGRAPALLGTPKDGQTLTARPGDWCATLAGCEAPKSATYDWYRCSSSGTSCAPITAGPAPAASTEPGSTYTLGHDDVSRTFKVKVTVYGNGGSASEFTPLSGAVAALAPSNRVEPTAAGLPQEGQTLVSDVGVWDGTPTLHHAYQWQRCTNLACTDVAGATGRSYIASADDVGAALRVRVTTSNVAGSAQAVSAKSATIQSGLVAPANTAPPAIAGEPLDGETLAASTGAWTRSPTTFGYQWQRCVPGSACVDIAGAVRSTYDLEPADVGTTIKVVVTAANPGGTNQAPSSPVGPVEAAPPDNRVAPAVAGAPVAGSTMTATPGTWAGTPTIDYAYRWQRCAADGGKCGDIAGATEESYPASDDDVGSTLRVRVIGSNLGGSGFATSERSATIQPGAPAPGSEEIENTSLPTIAGMAHEGETLTADPGAWTGSPVAYTYQWRRCDTRGNGCTDVAGAVQREYELGRQDANHRVRVRVTAFGTSAPAIADSAATDSVAPAASGGGAAPSNTVAPQIVGVAREGRSVSATSGTWEGASPSFAYQWRRCASDVGNCADVDGATAQTYVVDRQDVGAVLRVRVTATNDAGAASKDSEPTPTVDGRFPAAATVDGEESLGDVPGSDGLPLRAISSGKPEPVAAIEQPDASLPPHFWNYFYPRNDTAATFNAEMAASTPDPMRFAQVALGPKWAYAVNGSSVYRYDALTGDYLGAFAATLNGHVKIAYARGEVFLYSPADREFAVFDAEGDLKRRMQATPPPVLGNPNYSSIAVAWGEIWGAHTQCADSGTLIDIYDAATGVYKGTTNSFIGATNVAARQLSDPGNTDVANCEGNDKWWDISLAPDVDAAITNYRVLNRNPLLSLLSSPDPVSLLTHQPLYGTSGGTDEVPGMRWLLTAPVEPGSPARFGTKIVEYTLERDGQLGLVTAAPRRRWLPHQPGAVSDVGYRHHDVEILARGPLMEHEWINGTQCLEYVVSDGDFYLTGRKGENWKNQASGVESVTVRIGDRVVATSSHASSTCEPGAATNMLIDTNQVDSGKHVLTVTANVKGTILTKTNTDLRIDHTAPRGALDPLPQFVTGDVPVRGTMRDDHKGPRDWRLEVAPVGSTQPSPAAGCAPRTTTDAQGRYVCEAWNTRSLDDGWYDVSAELRDAVDNAAPSAARTAARRVYVDNEAPDLSLSGDLYEARDHGALAVDENAPVAIDAYDRGAGATRVSTSVDGLPRHEATQPCSTGGCRLEDTFVFAASEHAPGQHTIEVAAVDGVGNTSRSTWTVVVEDVTPGDTADPGETAGADIDYECSSDTGCDPTSESSAAPAATTGLGLAVPTLAVPLSAIAANTSLSGTAPSSFLACTAPDQPLNFASYSAGPQFDALELTRIARSCSLPDPMVDPWPTNYVSYIYGDCTPAPGEPCSFPLEVQSWPSCARNVSQYTVGPGDPAVDPDAPPPHTITTINDLPAVVFQGGRQIEVYTGRTTVDVYGTDPAVVRAAAGALQAAPPIPSTPLGLAPPWLPTLPPPVAGAMQGTLGCTT